MCLMMRKLRAALRSFLRRLRARNSFSKRRELGDFARFPVAFASASSRRRFSCTALKLASAFGVCFLGWCTGQVGSVQTFRSSPLSIPSETMASVVYLHVLSSGHFAFSGDRKSTRLNSSHLGISYA